MHGAHHQHAQRLCVGLAFGGSTGVRRHIPPIQRRPWRDKAPLACNRVATHCARDSPGKRGSSVVQAASATSGKRLCDRSDRRGSWAGSTGGRGTSACKAPFSAWADSSARPEGPSPARPYTPSGAAVVGHSWAGPSTRQPRSPRPAR